MKDTRGFLIIAQNSDVDYVRMAYALALSIKNTQCLITNVSIAVTYKKDVPKEYHHAFDKIIKLPTDDAKGVDWKVSNKWQYYNLSPYVETIALDADMLMTSNIEHWWDIMSRRDVCFSDSVYDFRDNLVESMAYRKVFEENDLPMIYTGMFYFKKTKATEEFFGLVEKVFKNWEEYYKIFIPTDTPTYQSGDISYAIALALSDIDGMSMNGVPTFTHMKTKVLSVHDHTVAEDWETVIPTNYNGEELVVASHKQIKPFHYHRKEWLTDTHIEMILNVIEEKKRYQ